jgi:hypothetical protein
MGPYHYGLIETQQMKISSSTSSLRRRVSLVGILKKLVFKNVFSFKCLNIFF